MRGQKKTLPNSATPNMLKRRQIEIRFEIRLCHLVFDHWLLAIGYCILVIGHRISPFWVEKLESLDIWKVWNVWTDLEFLKVWTVLNVWGSGQSAHGLLIKHIRIVILPICKTCVWNFWTDLEFVEFWTVWNECNWIIASALVPFEIFLRFEISDLWELRHKG